ncbi:MAG: cytochrome c biogenesis CcdA family protein [Myxococcota bacterium]|jgi:cytochrome c biogenesis protein CcdA|nr:cytochrome c biogenesis CcdA family protein [Myxococcota bacterium]
MFDGLFDNVGQYIYTSPWLALLAIFAGGALTASNPCVLAMIPLMMSFVAGRKEEQSSIFRSFLLSLVFVLGLAITFTALGMLAALAGQMYGSVSGVWNWLVALVCVLMGLHLMELVHFPIPSLGGRLQPKTRGFVGAFLLGLLFGLVSAPCAAPILIVLLAYLATSDSSIVWGGTLLLVYALGHSLLIIVAGTSMGAAKKLIESKRATRVLGVLRKAAGAVIILVGLYFAYRGFL